jgi:hypothetical protein
MADIVGTNDDPIRRQGWWNNITMNSAYFTRLSREMMRSMAVFPTNGRSFYLARAALEPSTSLGKKLFDCKMLWTFDSLKLCSCLTSQSCPNPSFILCHLPTHSSNNGCLCTLDFKPRFGYKNIFFSAPPTLLLLLPLVITFLHPIVILFTPRRQTNEQTS